MKRNCQRLSLACRQRSPQFAVAATDADDVDSESRESPSSPISRKQLISPSSNFSKVIEPALVMRCRIDATAARDMGPNGLGVDMRKGTNDLIRGEFRLLTFRAQSLRRGENFMVDGHIPIDWQK